jgi:hypothetical protein
VPIVIVGHGLAAAGLDRQPGLGAVEWLDLALFVDRQYHRVRGRLDIKTFVMRNSIEFASSPSGPHSASTLSTWL